MDSGEDRHTFRRTISFIYQYFFTSVQGARATQGTGLLNEVFARIKAIQFLLVLETLCVSERPRHLDKVARFGRTKRPIRRKGCSRRLSWQLLIFWLSRRYTYKYWDLYIKLWKCLFNFSDKDYSCFSVFRNKGLCIFLKQPVFRMYFF